MIPPIALTILIAWNALTANNAQSIRNLEDCADVANATARQWIRWLADHGYLEHGTRELTEKGRCAVEQARGGSDRRRTLPLTRGECERGPRPCPHRSCRYRTESESASCALDIADDGEHSLDEVGSVLGLTLQRVAQIQDEALKKCASRLRDYAT